MYVRVLQDELQFPDDQAMDQDTKSLIREVSHCFALISSYRILILVAVAPTAHPCAPHRRATNKTPPLLLYDVCAQIRYWICLTFCFCFLQRLVGCVFQALYTFVLLPSSGYGHDKLMFRTAPYIPPIDSSNASDSQNFDDTLLNMELLINDENDIDPDQEWEQTDQEPTDGENSLATPSHLRSSQDVTEHSILAEPINSTVVTARHEEPTPERKTLETRPTALPPSTLPSKRSSLAVKPELPQIDTILKPVSVADATPRGENETTVPTSRLPTIPVKAVADAAAAASTGPVIHRKGPKMVSAPKPHGQRPNRQRIRRKKPGEAVLVLGISNASDEDEVRTERDEEGFIEADGEERNWAGVDSLSAREVVDRYRLAVSRKGSTFNAEPCWPRRDRQLSGTIRHH